MDIDQPGVTVKFQCQTFKATRYSVRKKVGGKDVEEVEWGPTSRRSRPTEAVLGRNINSGTNGNETALEGEKVDSVPNTGIPGDNSRISPAAIPAPASNSLSVQVPSPPSPSVQLPEPASSFDRSCAQYQAPVINRASYEELTWDQLHGQCTHRGYPRKGAKDVLATRLASVYAAEGKSIPMRGDDNDASGTVSGKRERASAEGMMDSDIPTQS